MNYGSFDDQYKPQGFVAVVLALDRRDVTGTKIKDRGIGFWWSFTVLNFSVGPTVNTLMAKMIDPAYMTLTLRGGKILSITPHNVVETLQIPLRDPPVVIPTKQKGIPQPTKHEY